MKNVVVSRARWKPRWQFLTHWIFAYKKVQIGQQGQRRIAPSLICLIDKPRVSIFFEAAGLVNSLISKSSTTFSYRTDEEVKVDGKEGYEVQVWGVRTRNGRWWALWLRANMYSRVLWNSYERSEGKAKEVVCWKPFLLHSYFSKSLNANSAFFDCFSS